MVWPADALVALALFHWLVLVGGRRLGVWLGGIFVCVVCAWVWFGHVRLMNEMDMGMGMCLYLRTCDVHLCEWWVWMGT